MVDSKLFAAASRAFNRYLASILSQSMPRYFFVQQIHARRDFIGHNPGFYAIFR